MTDTPSDIKARQADQILEVGWPDDRTDRLPYRSVREECPCALCKDEWTGAPLLDPATIRADLKLERLEPIGNYAVRLAWNDGHSSGLYTWESLRQIGDKLGN